jgi:hypothetical protein
MLKLKIEFSLVMYTLLFPFYIIENNKWALVLFRKQQKCHYIMRWNSETGELFESGQHSNHPAPRIKIFYKWHLLETMRQNSAAEAEIRQRYTVKKVHKKYGRFVFKCSRCDG